MDRRILIALVAVAVVLVGWFVLWQLGDDGYDEAEVESGDETAVDEAVAGSPLRPRKPTPTRWTSRQRSRPGPIGKDPRIPAIDFGGGPVPDEDEEAAMRQAEAELDPADPWPADYDGINGAIGESLGDIRECYDQWLNLVPDLEGKVVVRFVIEGEDGGGVVTETEVAEATTDENTFFEGCVLNVMSDLTFEDPEGAVTVNYPFVFRSE